MDLFGMGNDEVRDTQIAMPNIPEVPKRELLAMEKETTGLYLSGHPMDEYRSLTQKAQAASVKQIIDDLTGESSRPVYKDGMTVRLACVITAVRLKSTRNGSMMAYVTAEDDTAAIELVVFPRSLQQCGAYLTEDSAVLLTGKIDAREDEAPKVLLNEAQPLTESAVESLQQPKKGTQKSVYTDAQAAKLAPQKLFLRISSLQSDEWTQIKEVLRTQPGDTPVYLYPMDTKKKDARCPSVLVQTGYCIFNKITLSLARGRCYNTIGDCVYPWGETVSAEGNRTAIQRSVRHRPCRQARKTEPTTGRLYHG